MSLDAHLIHRCTVQRATETLDAYRNTVPAWRDHLTDVACRLVTKAQRIASDDRAQFVVVTTYKLLVPAGTEVQEKDRVTDIRLEDGSQVAGPFSVAAILPRRSHHVHHLALELERVG